MILHNNKFAVFSRPNTEIFREHVIPSQYKLLEKFVLLQFIAS